MCTKMSHGNPGVRVAQWARSWDLTTHTAWVRARFVNYKKGCTRLAAASDKVYQLLAHGQWFSPGTPASSTAKTGRHEIAEILLKHQKWKIKSNHGNPCFVYLSFSRSITLYIFIIDQVIVLNEVQTLVRYTVSNLPIGSTGWKLGPQNLGGQGVLYVLHCYWTFTLMLASITYYTF